MRKSLLSILALALLLGNSLVCRAAEAKPLVTVAFAGYDRLLGDINFVGKLGGNPKLGSGLEMLLKMMTPVQDLSWLDTAKPWGAVVQSQGDQFPMFAFLPVKDSKPFLDLLGNSGLQTKEIGDGVTEITTAARPLYAQQKNGWMFIGGSPDVLKDVPADPIALLGDLPKKYNLAVRASVKNLPGPIRQMIISQVQFANEMTAGQRPGEADEAYAIRTNAMKQSTQQLTTLLNELDEVLLGWAIDQKSNSTYLDVQATAIPGTNSAKQFAALGQAKTDFAGFDFPGAALTAAWAWSISDDNVTQIKGVLTNAGNMALAAVDEQEISADQIKLAKQALGNVLEVAIKTVEGKKIDAGVMLLLDPTAVTFVAGGMIADGDKLEQTLKSVVAEVQKNDPDAAAMLKLNAETHQGVRFHTLALPVPDPKAVVFLGEKLDVVLGISNSSVYVSAGRDAAKTLKQVIDRSKAAPQKATSPERVSLAATPIAKFAATTVDETQKPMVAMVAGLLAQSSGKDHVTLIVSPISNGANARLEIEEGLLKLIGMMGQIGMGPPAAHP